MTIKEMNERMNREALNKTWNALQQSGTENELQRSGVTLDKKEIIINSLSFKQAAKWILRHEYRRHLIDLEGIKIDLENLKDIEIPAEAMELIDYHFEIPKCIHLPVFADTFVPTNPSFQQALKRG